MVSSLLTIRPVDMQVPATARWASGYNPYGTDLGKPCPGEKYPPTF